MTQMMIKSPSVEELDLVFSFTIALDNDSIVLPTAQYESTSTTLMNYDFVVDWGDGSEPDTITAWDQAENTHQYATADDYIVTIVGVFERILFVDATTKTALREVQSWGGVVLKDFYRAFYSCVNWIMTATDAPDVSACPSFERAFYGNTAMTGDLSGWNVSSTAATMERMFYGCDNFADSDLTGWDVSGVTTMDSMFFDTLGGHDLSTWDVSGVTTFRNMFVNSAFSGSLTDWDVGACTNFNFMFSGGDFNGDISGWLSTGATIGATMNSMFYQNEAFNQDLGSWDVGNVVDMEWMFASALAFNQDISGWDITGLTSLDYIFSEATSFNQSLNGWDTSAIISMHGTFQYATAFAQSLTGWDFQLVADATSFMSNMTYPTLKYDELIAHWAGEASHVLYVTWSLPDTTYTIATSQAAHDALENDPPWWWLADGGGI